MSSKLVKLFICTLCLIMLCALLPACGVIALHDHEWQDATCITAKTCTVCGDTDGKPLGHQWADATCTTPETCTVCGETSGNPIKHDWINAACEAPKTCPVCGAQEGDPLGHDWKSATFEEPTTCVRCGKQVGEPLPMDNFNRGKYDSWSGMPHPEQFVGVTGYVAVTDNSYLYSSSDSPCKNNWLSSPWEVSTYEKDNQFWKVVGTVEHKTPVTVVSQELEPGSHGTSRYHGYLLVECLDSGEQFYISVTDFVSTPYWENDSVSDILHVGPCLAVYHQVSDYYPVDHTGKRASVMEGETVLVHSSISTFGGVNYETNPIDAGTSSGRCYFNASDLTIIY